MDPKMLTLLEQRTAPSNWYSAQELKDALFQDPEKVAKHLQLALEKGFSLAQLDTVTLAEEVRRLNAEVESYEQQLKEWYSKLQGADANWAEAESKLKEANLEIQALKAALGKAIVACPTCSNGSPCLDHPRQTHDLLSRSSPLQTKPVTIMMEMCFSCGGLKARGLMCPKCYGPKKEENNESPRSRP